MMANVIDPKYEYDAPVYVDFTTLAVDQVPDDDADKWFDNRLEDDFLFDNSFNPVGAASKVPVEPPSLQPAALSDSTAPSNDSVPGENQGVSIKTEPTSPVHTEDQKEAQNVPIKIEPAVPVCDEDETEAKASTDMAAPGTKEEGEVGAVKLGKRSAIVHARAEELLEEMAKGKHDSVAASAVNKAAKVEPPEKAPKPKREKRLASQKASSNIHHILKKPKTPRRPVVLPSMSEPKQAQPPKKTTEELELEEVKRLQKEAKKALQQSRRSFQRLGKSSGPVVVKGSKPTTQAMEFNFHTKDRERSRPGSATKKEGVNPTNFPQTLRNFNSTDNYNPNFAMAKKPPTPELKTKPFKFCLDERFKSKSNTSSSEIIPTAEAVEKYQKATPPRFRSNPGSVTKKWKVKAYASDQSSSSSNSDDTGGPYATKLTVPNTPNLLTKGRSRPVTVKSATEEEEEVVAQMKEYQFKAKPINPDIFLKGGLHGVPRKKSEVQLTEAHTPVLATTERSRKRKAQEMSDTADGDEEEQAAATFHAQPMPNFNKITGLPTKKKMPITEPESPALALKRRRLHNSQAGEDPKEETESHVIKANPMPDMDKFFQPQLPHKCVETQPFSFEERDKNKPTRETFVEMILRKEKKAPFKAQPLPDFGLLPDLPPKAPPHNTKPKPFSLQTNIRGEQHTIKYQEKLEDKAKRAKEDAEFKATPASVLQKDPFIPQIPLRPLLTVDNFVLHSEVRSEQRAKYDAKRAREEYEKMTENLQRRALRAAEESKELAEYRKKLVHKAQSIHQYAPVIIKPGDRPITLPKSPYFRTDDRLRARHMVD